MSCLALQIEWGRTFFMGCCEFLSQTYNFKEECELFLHYCQQRFL